MVKFPLAAEGSVVLELARILVVNDDPASRLTLQTVLEAGGYYVDSAATAAEAVSKLDHSEYELVVSDLQTESSKANANVLAYANVMSYQPATAILTTYRNAARVAPESELESLLVEPEDVPGLLSHVANLIARRVNQQMERDLRHSQD